MPGTIALVQTELSAMGKIVSAPVASSIQILLLAYEEQEGSEFVVFSN